MLAIVAGNASIRRRSERKGDGDANGPRNLNHPRL